MTPELGLLVLAAIFLVGVVALAVAAIVLLPGAMLVEARLDELVRRRRAKRAQEGGET